MFMPSTFGHGRKTSRATRVSCGHVAIVITVATLDCRFVVRLLGLSVIETEAGQHFLAIF